MKKRSACLLAGIVILLAIGFSGFMLLDDDPVLAGIIKQLSGWADNHPAEKVYLQMDSLIMP